jgi:hypothetical protein
MNCWNSIFVVAEEMNIDFCFYISPFPSTMLTARQPHAAALPLKRFFYGPLRGRRSTLSPSRYRSLKVGPSKMPLQPKSLPKLNNFDRSKSLHNKPTTPHLKKQPTKTNPPNFKDENGTWIQCLTKGFRPKCTKVHEGATPKSNEEDNARPHPLILGDG